MSTDPPISIDPPVHTGPPTPPRLIAEELLLVLLDPASGTLRLDATRVDLALGAAVLSELALDGAVRPGASGTWLRPAPVTAVAVHSPDPVLQQAFQRIADRSRPAPKLLTPLARGLRSTVLERLVTQGILVHEQQHLLGMLPAGRWRTLDPGPADGVRGRLRQALLTDERPDRRTAALVALLAAIDANQAAIGATDRTTVKLIRYRGKQFADADWAASTLRQVVTVRQATLVAGLTAATVAAGTVN